MSVIDEKTWEAISLLLTALGAVSGSIYLVEKYRPLQRLSWRQARRSAKIIAERLLFENYIPTLIIGIGRGGAIMGALISYRLKHKDLIVIDRKYQWVDGCRKDSMVMCLEFPATSIEKVLLVAGEAHTGGTMRLYKDYLQGCGAKEIRTAVFYLQDGCIQKIDYSGIKGGHALAGFRL